MANGRDTWVDWEDIPLTADWWQEPESVKPTLKRVRQYLSIHLAHVQYRSFKKLGFPIGSGMVESACKWLIQQRFKGTGMRWSESGFNHLLHLHLAWASQRFDSLFADHSLTLELHSPNY